MFGMIYINGTESPVWYTLNGTDSSVWYTLNQHYSVENIKNSEKKWISRSVLDKKK